MNEKGNIKQFAILGGLLLIAVLVLSSLWGGLSLDSPVADAPLKALDEQDALGSNQKTQGINFTDIRSGSGMRSGNQVKQLDLTSSQSQFDNTATSTAFNSATSTPFQSRLNLDNPFSGTRDGENLSGLPQASSDLYQSIAPSRVVNPGGNSRQVVSQNQTQHNSTFNKRAQDKPKKTSSDKPNEAAEQISSTQDAQDQEAEEKLADIISDVMLSGHVVDNHGAAINSIPISLKLIQALPEDKALFGSRTLKATTNESGFYAFPNLVKGDYQLCTEEARGYKSACQRPHSPNTAVDFTLRSTANGRVFGVVKDDQDRVMSGVSISAVPHQQNRAVSDEQGQFNLAMSVNDGLSYNVYFTKKDYKRVRVSVKGEDVLKGKEVEAIMKYTNISGFDVTGFVYDEAGSPLQGKSVRLHSPSLKLGYSMSGTSDNTGRFTIKNVQAAKDFQLSVSLKGGYTFDNTPYRKMEIYEGLPPLQLYLKSTGKGTITARFTDRNGGPLAGVGFRLISGSTWFNQKSDVFGQVTFNGVPATQGGNSIRINNDTTTPRHQFSGIKLAPGEFKSLDLVADLGTNNLIVTVIDEQTGAPIGGAKGNLTWEQSSNGVKSATIRAANKTSNIDLGGTINFNELGLGSHKLQVSHSGYHTYSETINISQQNQVETVKLIKR